MQAIIFVPVEPKVLREELERCGIQYIEIRPKVTSQIKRLLQEMSPKFVTIMRSHRIMTKRGHLFMLIPADERAVAVL